MGFVDVHVCKFWVILTAESAAVQRWSSNNLAALCGSLGLDIQLSCVTDVSI